jgi:hypothetical protein
MRRRDLIRLLGGATAAWPLAARAQQAAMPVIGFVRSADASSDQVRTFRKGLGETGYIEGQNVTVEYHWLEGQFDRLPAVMADLDPAADTPGSTQLRDLQEAARTEGLQIRILNAATIGEIDAAFATFGRERPDALFVSGNAFFNSRRVQIASLAARDRIPASYIMGRVNTSWSAVW